MNPPAAERRERTQELACRFLREYGVQTLPVNPFDIIRAGRWGLVTYRALAVKIGVGVPDIIDACRSPDGYTVFNGRSYCISYNDGVRPFSRILFTLFHEVGHIYLSHFTDFAAGGLLPEERPALETEANRFASEVMAPAAVIRGCGLKTPEALARAGSMSLSAARLRLEQMKNRCFTEEDKQVAQLFDEYVCLYRARRKRNSPSAVTHREIICG